MVSAAALAIREGVPTEARERAMKPCRKEHRMHKITLYVKKGCHLCDAAKHVIDNVVGQRAVALIEIVDITQNPALNEEYREAVPVVFVDGKERFRHTIDPQVLAGFMMDETGENLLGIS
jgi:glutaredoxin